MKDREYTSLKDELCQEEVKGELIR